MLSESIGKYQKVSESIKKYLKISKIKEFGIKQMPLLSLINVQSTLEQTNNDVSLSLKESSKCSNLIKQLDQLTYLMWKD